MQQSTTLSIGLILSLVFAGLTLLGIELAFGTPNSPLNPRTPNQGVDLGSQNLLDKDPLEYFEAITKNVDEKLRERIRTITQWIPDQLNQQGLTATFHRKVISVKSLLHPGKTIRLETDFQDINIAIEKGFIFINCALADLPRNSTYNYLITSEGDVVFGKAINSWEIGVKHFNLAFQRSVVVAGSLNKDNEGNILFNLKSGTFTRDLVVIFHFDENQLAKTVQLVFENLIKQSQEVPNLVYTPKKLISTNPPPYHEIYELCKSQWFLRYNKKVCLSELDLLNLP